jgi:hypothetical protein
MMNLFLNIKEEVYNNNQISRIFNKIYFRSLMYFNKKINKVWFNIIKIKLKKIERKVCKLILVKLMNWEAKN